YYHQAVRPILDAHYPGLVHSAALLGWGSEVLGYDTARSMDHEWGARTQLFLREEERALGPAIVELLSQTLPHEFRGLPVDLVQPGGVGNFVMTPMSEGPVRHGVRV